MVESQRLGASLYVPATYGNLLAVANGTKYPNLRSVIFCTEDSVAESDLQEALRNLYHVIEEMGTCRTLRFVRPRNALVLQRILDMPGAEKLDGFVLPKFCRRNMRTYLALLRNTEFKIMPTLETAEVFDDQQMRRLRDSLLDSDWAQRILALRIGGNDLLAILGIRRPRGVTLYETPIGDVISSLVRIFKPAGMQLTAPVFEYLDDKMVLEEEIKKDMAFGLVGKTAIHPSQVDLIERFYRVRNDDLAVAQRMLSNDGPGVFRMDGAMCEPATHAPWARGIIERAATYGLID
jgi:citrate lyase beta subunit